MSPVLVIPTATISRIKFLVGILFSLFDNHILDWSGQGLFSANRLLDTNGITHVDASRNLFEAQKLFIFVRNEVKAGVYTYVEYKFLVVDERRM